MSLLTKLPDSWRLEYNCSKETGVALTTDVQGGPRVITELQNNKLYYIILKLANNIKKIFLSN